MNRTPLYDAHVAAGGRMVPFAGWEMPVQYTGVLAEAAAVRENVGLFDVSHMGRLLLIGPNAQRDLRALVTCEIDDLEDGAGRYGLLTNDEGGTIDDLIVYRRSADEWSVIVNASNHEKDVAWMRGRLSPDTEPRDVTARTVLLAVQGPGAVGLLSRLSPEGDLEAVPTFGLKDVTLAGVPLTAMRSGYTGEDGFELTAPAEHGIALWDALVAAGAIPCGLAARDALRVEAGLPLYGHELTETMSPIAAGLGWAIRKTGGYPGEAEIERARAEGTPRRLVGIILGLKRLIPAEAPVFNTNGTLVGEVSSGVVSPALDTAIAMAFVDREVKLGEEVTVDIRGKREPGTLVNKRFLKRAA